MIIIVTCLALIFTVGLDDGDRDGLSAYAVFNRGFERLMGSVDAEALMAQHVGGALAGAGGAGMMGGAAAGPVDEEEEHRGRGAGRRQRQNRAGPAGGNNLDGDENGDGNRQNRARKSGKKARRRNLEQRSEMQNQREAAAALGMQFGDGAAMEEQVAMQRMIEEQIADENRRDD